MNERIRFPQVRVIAENNEQLGVMDTREAISLARDRGHDLILVAPQAQPPVCRIMDYGKFKYEKSKKDKKAKSAANELKMVRLHPRTGPHDRDILVRHSERFLREGHKVRVVCQFKGRENAYPELGKQQLDAIANQLAEIANVEGAVNKVGRDMTMMLSPKPGLKPLPKVAKESGKNKGKADVAEAEDEDAKFEAMQQELAAEAGDEDVDVDDIDVDDIDVDDVDIDDASDADDADLDASATDSVDEKTEESAA